MKIQELYETKVRILSENKDSNVMNVMVPFIQSDIKNQNGRIYKKSLLQREIARVQGSVKRGSFIGAGDHPSSGLADIATASHIVTALSLDEKGQGTAELRILPTERGKSIQTLIRNNAQLGVSIRGFGDLKNGVVQDNYKLVGLDIVTNPSFKNAVFDKSNIFESQNFEEENEDEDLEKSIDELERESYLNAVNSGFIGDQKEWLQNCGSLREAMGLPEKESGKTSVKKLTKAQVNARTYSYFLEACSAGFVGDFNTWKEKHPKLVEMASEVKIVKTKEAPETKEKFESKSTWAEIQLSGFRGTQAEYKEKFPSIEIIRPEIQKRIVEKTLEEEAAIIFTALSKDKPNSQITLEDVKKMLEKEEIVKADKRLRKRAIYIVNSSIAGSGSVPTQEMLEKMVAMEIENLKERRKEMREKNWQCYKRLLSD